MITTKYQDVEVPLLDSKSHPKVRDLGYYWVQLEDKDPVIAEYSFCEGNVWIDTPDDFVSVISDKQGKTLARERSYCWLFIADDNSYYEDEVTIKVLSDRLISKPSSIKEFMELQPIEYREGWNACMGSLRLYLESEAGGKPSTYTQFIDKLAGYIFTKDEEYQNKLEEIFENILIDEGKIVLK